MRKINVSSIAIASTFVMLNGCGGSGEGLDLNGNPVGSQIGSTVLTANFQSIQDNVFTPICTACHIGANAPHGLRLDAVNSYALLVGVNSEEAPELQRVKPGDPNASYLIQKLEGTAAVGQRMPFGGPYLPQSTIEVIRQWITNGAQKSIAATSNDKWALAFDVGMRVTTTSPLDNTVVSAPLTQIVIGFNRDLDITLINDSNIVLEKSLATAINDTTPIPATLTIPQGNLQTLLITPTTSLQAGQYQVHLRTSGSALTSIIGQDFILSFTVGDQQ